jgi:hypothetical protein
LRSGGAPASGAFDFQFILYTAASDGGQVGATVALEDVAVSNGIFTVALDFGAAAFDGQARWLQVGVRSGASTGAYGTLSPRHPLTAVPYALYATKAPWSGLQSVPAGFADGTDDVGWSLTGNVGTTPGTHFLGTTDNQALVIKVNGQRALRIEPVVDPNGGFSPNVIGGSSANAVSAGIYGATIAGGGSPYLTCPLPSGPCWNRVPGNFGTVGGGMANTASGAYATVGGGARNVAAADTATVGGGHVNSARGNQATVGGGSYNTASGAAATVAGGSYNAAAETGDTVAGGGHNIASGGDATVGGGTNNIANGYAATVGGGNTNEASGLKATVAGGTKNTADGYFATVGGGDTNKASGLGALVAGGYNNTASGLAATVGGGNANTASQGDATVGGGYSNTASGLAATIGGGGNNTASGKSATVGGGEGNRAGSTDDTSTGDYATVGGGKTNRADGTYATVGGGYNNTVSFPYAIVGGGHDNKAMGHTATVGGGAGNLASGYYATVGGGFSNTASGDHATVGGGLGNSAHGDFSFAAGRRATASSPGCFVWGDSSDSDVGCNDDNRWVARARGGVYFYTNSGLTSGVYVPAGDSAWTSVSDRNLKENFADVNSRALLDRLAETPVTTWNYKSQDASIRHIGPVAQDFYAAFGVGEDDMHISTIDADGVALAAIQGLYQVVQEKEARIAAQDAEIAMLKAQQVEIEARLAALERQAAVIGQYTLAGGGQ